MSDEFQVRCVKPKEGIDSQGSALQEAFDLLKEHGFSPTWITQEECLEVETANKDCYFVMDPFEGSSFEHLKHIGCRVYGAQCILATLLMKIELPRKKNLLYNLAMKDVVISCTNLDHSTRNKVFELVELMGGDAVRALTEEVTHLIAGSVGSEKYFVAGARGKHIMTVDWVYDVWEKAKHRYISAFDEQFLKFRCPIFKNLVVTVSGLPPDERKKVKQYIENEGGKYSGEMKLNECTHLILKEPKGSKYEFAKKWKINIVTTSWLYESLDKNYCQDERNYPVTGNSSGGVKTSTPEKSRRSAQVPNITDISAISTGQANVDETAFLSSCMTTRMDESTASAVDQLDLVDLNVTTEPFLDSCRVYLSGIKSPLLEKCKKIINAGGCTRFNAINECVTHVIVGDRVESDIETLKAMETRPHVVTPTWLAECFLKRRHVDEQSYLSPVLPPPAPDVQLPKLAVPKRKSSQIGGTDSKPVDRPQEEQSSTSEADKTVITVPVNGAGDEEAQLLSQYLGNGTGGNNGLTDQPMDEVDGSTTTTDQHDDATQDTESQSMHTQDGVFAKKTFIFCGFSEEQNAALAEIVSEARGRVLKERTRKVPDYAVVPLPGFPVEQTVGAVATNAWLQICVETQTLLDVHADPLFQPIYVDEAARPLQGCVLSVSGYSGAERDCLIHLADLLGADCQEYFVRKANKSLKASTHLIVKEPTGSKYAAAIKWNIPALTREWLFACAKSGKTEDAQNFHIDKVSSETSQPATSSAGTSGLSSKRQSTVSASSESSYAPTDGKRHSASSAPQSTKTKQAENDRQEDISARLRRMSSKGLTIDRIPSSSAEMPGSSNEENKPSSSASDGEKGQNTQAVLSNPMAGAKAMAERNPQSQKENMTVKTPSVKGKALATPAAEQRTPRSRVQELQQESRRPDQSPGLESPSVFLAPGYRPKFDLTDVFSYLQSPDVPPKSKKRESLPLEELFQHHLAEGVKNSSTKRSIDAATDGSQSQEEDRGPLFGVTICVSKKLSLNLLEYNNIVTELGGEYTWQYTQQCTHFIFQGRANDINKEFRQAKSHGKLIVSPHWLYACQERRTKVEESMYPHNYNPNLNLGGVVKTDTPGSGRPVRRSARNTPKPGQESSQAAGSKTPGQPLRHKAWQESVAEMKTWQEESKEGSKTSASAKDTPVKGALDFEVNASTSKRSPQNLRTKESAERSKTKGSTESSRTMLSSEGESSRTNRSSEGESSRTKGSSAEVSHDENARDGFSTSVSVFQTSSVADGDRNGGKNASVNAEKNVAEVTGVPAKEQTDKDADGVEEDGTVTPGICDAVHKTLESFKASSSGRSKRSRGRRNRKSGASSSGGQLDTSGNESEVGRQHQHHPHPAHAPVPDSHHTEPSQSLQVTWDDPIGRQEQEKLAHKLERVCTPSQNTEDFMAQMEMPELDHTPVNTKARTNRSANKEPLPRSPTPEPPPLAFPTAKNVSKVSEPQPVELLSDDSCDDQADVPAPPPVILISGLQQHERVEYAAIVEKLGGTVLDKQQFDPACTHVVIGQPTRNEKFLAAVATGLWVLHKSYFHACKQEDRFVNEEDHEWGNPSMSSLLASMNAQTNKLAAAAYKWRRKVQDMKKADSNSKGAYQGWRVLLVTDGAKADNFRRLLTAGGATVLSNKPPFTDDLSATHAFVELHRVKLSESDMDILASNVMYVLKPEFIAAHLTDDPPPCPEEFTPPEILALKNSLLSNVSRKRRASGSSSSGSTGKRRR